MGFGVIGDRSTIISSAYPSFGFGGRNSSTYNHDTTIINVQARLAFYSGKGQLIGNVNSGSYGGIAFAMPELYAEAVNIMGTKWSAWIGAKFFRGGDIHMADYFYFDDHSTQGFGISYKNTNFAIMFPGNVDTGQFGSTEFLCQYRGWNSKAWASWQKHGYFGTYHTISKQPAIHQVAGRISSPCKCH